MVLGIVSQGIVEIFTRDACKALIIITVCKRSAAYGGKRKKKFA
jgi:hypothetical protein